MEGDEAKRFCAGCGCFVHNVEQMDAAQAEALLSNQERVCTRLTISSKREILTRDGWIPRLILAGAVAATVSGCAVGDAAAPNKPDSNESKKTAMVEKSDSKPELGWPNIVAKKPANDLPANFMGFISDRVVAETDSAKKPPKS